MLLLYPLFLSFSTSSVHRFRLFILALFLPTRGKIFDASKQASLSALVLELLFCSNPLQYIDSTYLLCFSKAKPRMLTLVRVSGTLDAHHALALAPSSCFISSQMNLRSTAILEEFLLLRKKGLRPEKLKRQEQAKD